MLRSTINRYLNINLCIIYMKCITIQIKNIELICYFYYKLTLFKFFSDLWR